MSKLYFSVLQSNRGKRIFLETLRTKFTKADVIKRLMKEQKACFGALLETKKDKIRRLKRQNKGIIPTPTPSTNNVDSEFAWILNNSSNKLRMIRFNTKSRSNFVPVTNNIASQNNLSAVAPDPECRSLQSDAVKFTAPKAVKVITRQALKIKATPFVAPIEKKEFSNPLPDVNLANAETKTLHKTYDEKTVAQVSPKVAVSENDLRETRAKTVLSISRNYRKTLSPERKPETVELKSESEDIPEFDIKHRRPKIKTAVSLFAEKGKVDAQVWDSTILSISTMEDKESLQLPSVTKILNTTMPSSTRKILDLWMEKMIRELGQDGFDAYKRDLLGNGKLLHSSIDSALRQLPVEVPETLRPCFDSVQHVLNEIKEVRAIESHVVHRSLRYRGVLDCVASYKGKLCLFDWKKSDKQKQLLKSTYDAPLQIASYIGALNADDNYPFQIETGIIVVAYTTGKRPTVFRLDARELQFYWKQWLNRLDKYYQMQSS